MGDYTPYGPRDIGMQWVPIDQANYVPDEVTERGYSFQIANTVTPVSGSYNTAIIPTNLKTTGAGLFQLMSVYQAGSEELTGPIEQVIIPVSSVQITGSGTSVIGAATATQALLAPNDGARIQFTLTPQVDVGINFDTGSFNTYLQGKRILNVSVLYQVASSPSNLAACSMSVRRLTPASNTVAYALGLTGPLTLSTTAPTAVADMGDLNLFWDATVTNPKEKSEVYPWRYAELNNFSATGTLAARLIALFQIGVNDVSRFIELGYCALQVTYCEETRLLYGADYKGLFATSGDSNYRAGTSLVRLKDPVNFANPALSPGRYTITNVYRDIANGGAPPTLHAIRQLYELPSIQGINVNESLTVDRTFTKDTTDILPQLALHTASGVVTGSHVYGLQIGAPVYGSITAIQDVDPDGATGQQYPQVRFYARRFGSTTVALTLRSVAATGTAVSISVSDFDALPEIVDGWREVTLRFPGTIPTFTGPAGTPQAWRWDAVGEVAGSQWQVLGADGPSPTGTQSYAAATYYAPFGATEELTWMSPAVTGTTVDTLSDAVVIFAQDPPTITGFTLTGSTQAVTGIGLRCGAPPRCIPTGISYTRVTWSPVSIAVTGFGQYELERFDALDNEWQQIMNATAPTVTGYNDYEARVGIQSLYRIRACDVLDFCGPWTSGAATIPAPGITPTGGNGGVLIFTSNSNQAGAYNLAYRMQWEGGGGAQEDFAFPEAKSVAFQDMYNKDFPTAFHGTERGGEQFSRVLLVQGASIAAESLANFRSLRDMAWADIPYVAVRDELGNRWYATVLVPAGNVRRNRTLYFAQVDIVETTDTASPVTVSS